MARYFTLVVSDGLREYSDKCRFPPSVLKEVLRDHPKLPHPLVFKITNGDNSIFVGVKEFTSEEDHISVPKSVLSRISGPVTAELALLPKATFLQLEPAQFYSHITNWKYYLESLLSRDYTTLTRNESFGIQDAMAGKVVELHVEDANEDTVIVVDTDIDLDVVPLNDIMAAQQLDHSQNMANLENIPILSTQKVLLEPFNKSVPKIFKIDLRKSPLFTILLSSEDRYNVDLLAGLDKFVTLENFTWATMSQDSQTTSKSIYIDLRSDTISNYMQKSSEDSNCWLYVVPFAWDHPATVTLEIQEGAFLETTDTMPSGTVQCSNCLKCIEKTKLPLHEAFCLRNNVRCSCGAVFTRKIPSTHWCCDSCDPIVHGDSSLFKFKHDRLFHTPPYKCEQCDNGVQYATFLELVEQHKSTECPSKLHECIFCHLIVPQEEATYQDKFANLTHHENACGNKTTECFQCGKVLKSKDLASHMRIHYMDKIEFNAEAVTRCTNENCVSVFVNGAVSSNELGLCEMCYGPLYASVLDPTNIKLQNRIERKYMIQLTKGCGNAWCTNVECATGNAIKGSIKELLGHIQNDLLVRIAQPQLPINSKRIAKPPTAVWFCLNESVHKRKELVEQLLSEGRYSLEMIYKAVGTQNGEEATRTWLSQNGL